MKIPLPNFPLQLVILSCALAASADTAAASNKALAITLSIQEQPGTMLRCPFKFGGTITAQGSSALLGRVVLIATDCITPLGPLYNFSTGRLIITTVNGDQVFADYSGQLVPTGDGAKYVFSGATFQITGGNGQYAYATGGGTLSGGEDLVSGNGQLSMTGKIAYRDK